MPQYPIDSIGNFIGEFIAQSDLLSVEILYFLF